MRWPRILLGLTLGLVACGGEADPSFEPPPGGAPGPRPSSPPAPALPGPDHPDAQCTLLGNGCARALSYQMCCLEGVCTFTFSDGVGFATLGEALGYCTAGETPDGATPLAPAAGGGYLPPGEDETREGYRPDGTPIGGDGGSHTGDPSSDGGSSSHQSQSGGQCYGSVRACEARSGPSECRENPGCAYTYEACFGTAWACQSFSSPSACGYQLGCRWDHYYDQCVGGAASCGSRSSSGACHGQRGCYWRDAACTGGAWGCSRNSTESGCRATAGCYWR